LGYRKGNASGVRSSTFQKVLDGSVFVMLRVIVPFCPKDGFAGVTLFVTVSGPMMFTSGATVKAVFQE
jgi:hypothetical protein